MSVSHCMHLALEIAAGPDEGWGDAIQQIPERCPHPDCGEPRNCRERVADYLRMQYRVKRRRSEAARQ